MKMYLNVKEVKKAEQGNRTRRVDKNDRGNQ